MDYVPYMALRIEGQMDPGGFGHVERFFWHTRDEIFARGTPDAKR
jgi:hypothetical protein